VKGWLLNVVKCDFFLNKNNFVKVNKKQMVDLLFYPT